MSICGICNSDPHIIKFGKSSRECLRPQYHTGPHLIQTAEDSVKPRVWVAWETSLCDPGTCTGCDSEDSTEWCEAYWEVEDPNKVKKFLELGEED